MLKTETIFIDNFTKLSTN